jgi:osmotically-inducible protein OsmY
MPKEGFNDSIHNPYIDLYPFMEETHEIKETGTHFGKGPKNYRPTDDLLYEKVCETLYLHPEVDASQIIIKVKDGEVTLSGRVPNREMKWEAENCVADLPGVSEVFNELRSSHA